VRLYLKKTPSQKMVGGVAQGVGPEFKPKYCKNEKKKEVKMTAGHWWPMPVLLATQEAETEATPGKWLSRPFTHKKGAGGVAQGIGPEFNPKYHTHTKKS
jgi:hypothetical protein